MHRRSLIDLFTKRLWARHSHDRFRCTVHCRTMVTIHYVKGKKFEPSSSDGVGKGKKFEPSTTQGIPYDGKGTTGKELNTEQHLSALQRQVADTYSAGDYEGALELAKYTQTEMTAYFGKGAPTLISPAHGASLRYAHLSDHPAVASVANNIGLFHKRLGRYDDAVSGGRSA